MSAIFSGHDGAADALPARAAVFIDKDGTLLENVPDNVDPARLRFTAHALEALRLLAERGYPLIVVSNEPGLAYGRFTRAELTRLQLALTEMMQREGVPLADFYACTHAPGPAGPVPACLCRKPAPGLLRQAARTHRLDLQRSWMVGDLLDDVEAGRRAGCRTVMLDVGSETAWRMSPLRTPHHRAHDLLEAARTIIASDEAATPHDAGVALEAPLPQRDEPPGLMRHAASALQALARGTRAARVQAGDIGRFS
ncbi:MAG TPA: HAD-IIIA family hydrolase [Albitalea sp.]